MRNILLPSILLAISITNNAIAENLPLIQQKLMDIASEEAQIAGIGANKYMMLYGKANPIAQINRWNAIQHRPNLTDAQIAQINELEATKQSLLAGIANE